MSDEQIVTERLHALVEGRVQGVGFRYFVMTAAQELNLTGWVRNCFDGNVEVTAEGMRKDLETLIFFLRKGPRGSFVSGVSTNWQQATNEFSRFDVIATF
jgi:acylphosphatase